MEGGSNHRQELGKTGEDLACRYLESKGHRILERNYRSGHLEIDIISLDADGIHFVEVKTRRDSIQAPPQDNVGKVKQDRIVKARLQLDFLRSYAMYERVDKALNNVEKIVDNFMFSSKASSLELGEKQNIIREISNLVKERLKTEYAEYNEQLCLTMLKYCDNFMLKEGQARITRENYTQLDFSKAPKDWWS